MAAEIGWIKGTGVGAAAAAEVLLGAGWRVVMSPSGSVSKAKARWILLNAQTTELIDSVFGRALRLPVRGVLRGRLVFAQPGLPGHFLAERSAVLRADEFDDALTSVLHSRYGAQILLEKSGRPPSNFDISTVPRYGARVVRSGSRQAWQFHVELNESFDYSVFEAVPSGWLYLSPIEGRHAVLHCVTCEGDSDAVHCMIAESREIGHRIGTVMNCDGPFPASAEFVCPSETDATMPCSRGVFRWDPICGDGTGASVRSALLAAAGVKAMRAGAEMCAVREHVIARSAVAFGSHIVACEALYQGCNFDRRWHFDLQALGSAKEEMQRYGLHAWRFELRNLELCPRG